MMQLPDGRSTNYTHQMCVLHVSLPNPNSTHPHTQATFFFFRTKLWIVLMQHMVMPQRAVSGCCWCWGNLSAERGCGIATDTISLLILCTYSSVSCLQVHTQPKDTCTICYSNRRTALLSTCIMFKQLLFYFFNFWKFLICFTHHKQ